MSKDEVVVIGAGVIGLSTAFTLADAGFHVSIVDPFPGHGASYVAAGMIAPTTEAIYGEENLVDLCNNGSRLWPSFGQQIANHTKLSVGLDRTGTLFVGSNNNDRALIQNLLPLYAKFGLEATWCSSAEIRNREPLLSASVAGGIDAANDIQIDNRCLLSALVDAVQNLGVSFVRSRASSLVTQTGHVSGVITEHGTISSSYVVVAAGWQSADIGGFPDNERLPLRPIKGQIIRLMQHEPGLRMQRTVRALVGGRSVYVVPRRSGQIVVGATVEDKGADFRVTAGAAYELLRDAITVLPVLGEAEIQNIEVGMRPGTPDNFPIIGSSALAGLIYATGHYRHGILLAPITAYAIREIVENGRTPEWATPFRPRGTLR